MRRRGLQGVLAIAAVAALVEGAESFSQGAAGRRLPPILRTDEFQAVAAGPKAVVAVGLGGLIEASPDGGKSWTRRVLPGPSSLIAAAACPNGAFIALDFYRKLWVGDPSGKDWSPRELKTKAVPLAAACGPDGRYWVVGSYSTMLVSADGGKTWKEKSYGEDAHFNTIQFADKGFGVITGEFGLLLTTSDGGKSWSQGRRIPNDFYPYSAFFADSRTGWVTGLAGTLLHTRDGGASWTRQPNGIGAPMFGLARHEGRVYAVGASGRMLVLKDGRWEPFPHGKAARSYLRAAVGLDGRGLLIAGGAGALYVVETGQGRDP